MNNFFTSLVRVILSFACVSAYAVGDIAPFNEIVVGKNCCNQGPPGPTGPTGTAGATGATGATGIIGPNALLAYAYAFTITAQTAIPAGSTVLMTVIDPNQSGGFVINSGGVQVPTAGVYQISYLAGVSGLSEGLGISVNGNLALPGSVSGTIEGGNSFLNGTNIVRLNAGDIVTLINSNTIANMSTVVTLGTYQSAPTVASLTLLRLAE